MANFTPERSDTIRANLINHLAENPHPHRRPALWATGFVLAGILAGAGASPELSPPPDCSPPRPPNHRDSPHPSTPTR